MKLTDRELATVLASLRCFQRLYNPAAAKAEFEHFQGREPLSPKEIDRLCEQLNCRRACTCGNIEFHAHQRATIDVVVNGNNDWLRNASPDNAPVVEDCTKPEGPFTCTACGKVYESLNDLSEQPAS